MNVYHGNTFEETYCMYANRKSSYDYLELNELSEIVVKEYYNPISISCNNIRLLMDSLKSGISSCDSIAYMTISEKVITEIESYINGSKLSLIPYIKNLSRKKTPGHNCITCSGNCLIQHATKINEFKTEQQQFKAKVYPVMIASVRLCRSTNDNRLKALNKEMLMLGLLLRGLLLMEQKYILPKIRYAQKNIGVVDASDK